MMERAEVVAISEAEARVLTLIEEFGLSWRKTRDDALNLGEALIELKAELGHGGWLPWLEDFFPMGERTARNLMDLSRNRHILADLEADVPWTAALKWVKDQRLRARGPRPMLESGTVEARGEPLVRAAIDIDTADLVADILRVCFPDALTALDATYGSGAFWNGTAHVQVTAVDIDPARAPNGVVDFRDLSALQEAGHTFDVVLLDPPHLSDGGEDSVMAQRFGTYPGAELEEVVMRGVQEAWRVGVLGIVVKVTDHVHGQVFVPESDWVRDALDGLVPFEVVHQVRSRPMIDPKWLQPQLSAYNNLSTFMVFRHGDQRHTRA